jgi:glutamate--cysteine ligase
MIKDWTIEEQAKMRGDVPRQGLVTPFRNGTVQDLAKQSLAIATSGLKRRARLDSAGNDESGFLDPLRSIAESGRTSAEELLEAYATRWGGTVDPVYEELRY